MPNRGINLGALYGALGEGVADAHHLKPLASKPEKTKTQLKDLITVCPNCHRVLHLPKAGGSIQKVKKAFTGNWPVH
jgi:5-methylcytosine-specific restriction protein A